MKSFEHDDLLECPILHSIDQRNLAAQRLGPFPSTDEAYP